MTPRIHYVTLGVSDIPRATAFYEALGFRKSSASQETISFFQAGPLVLALFGREALYSDATVPAGAKGYAPVTLAWNQVSENEVDAVFAHAVACGATALKAPQKVFWGGYSSYFADPDGHLWEIAFNPFITFDADGHPILG